MLFRKRKKPQTDWEGIAYALAELEPKKIDRLAEIAKDIRKHQYDLDVFINGRPDEVDKIVRDINKEKKDA